MFEFEEDLSAGARIKVVGIGGGGGNAIKTMMHSGIEGVDFVVINTDVQALRQNDAPVKVQIGKQATHGLGAGANPDLGRQAALEDIEMIRESLTGANMIFLTAGMGGGTGTGATPVVAKVARELGILTVGVVTKPFSFEGRRRMKQAEQGIAEMKEQVDTLICVPNDNLLLLAEKDTPLLDSFKMVDQVLLKAVRGISDLITIPGLINLDFADLETIMRSAGIALMGTGVAKGDNRALEAAKMAISSPLLEKISIAGATGILLNITGSPNMTLFEVNEACKLIQEEANENTHIIFGSVIDNEARDEIRITVIATGFDPRPSVKTGNKGRVGEAEQKEPFWSPQQKERPAVSIHDVYHETSDHSEKNQASSQPVQVNSVPQKSDDDGEGFFARPAIPAWGAPSNDDEPRARRPKGHALDETRPLSQASLQEVERVPGQKKSALPAEKQSPDRSFQQFSGFGDFDEEKYEVPAFIRRRAD